MSFRVQVPPGIRSGQILRIRCPDGYEGQVKVPKGLKEYDTFVLSMESLGDAFELDPQKTSSRGTGPSSRCSGAGGEGSTLNGRRSDASGGKGVEVTAAEATGSFPPYGFLDREILDMKDFTAALVVGMVIGISIVLGFLVGVLLVTDRAKEVMSY